MDHRKKIIATGIGMMLFFVVAVFAYFLSVYDPPKRNITDELRDGESLFSREAMNGADSLVDNGNDQRSIEVPKAEPAHQSEESISGNNNSKYGTILVTVKKLDGAVVPGLLCQLSVVQKNPNLTTTGLYSKKTDANGECYFFDMQPFQNYWVEFFNESDRMFHETVEVNDLQPGESFVRELRIRTSISKAENGELAKAGKECVDSDGGYRPDKFGYVEWYSRDGKKNKTNDLCLPDSDLLMEAMCDNNGYAYGGDTFKCTNGCRNGACIDASGADVKCFSSSDAASCNLEMQCSWVSDKDWLRGYCKAS
jgi:hypothetical protein